MSQSPLDPRFTIHKPTVQQAPPTFRDPKKKLSHTSKYGRSKTGGRSLSPAMVPIRQRLPVIRVGGRQMALRRKKAKR